MLGCIGSCTPVRSEDIRTHLSNFLKCRKTRLPAQELPETLQSLLFPSPCMDVLGLPKNDLLHSAFVWVLGTPAQVTPRLAW